MNLVKTLLGCTLSFLLTLTTSQAQKIAVPYYQNGYIIFYDLSSNPATQLGTFNTTVAGTNYKPNGVAFYGTDMFVAYDDPSHDGFLHFKGVQVSGGSVTFTSAVKVSTGAISTEIVVDASGNLYVGCGFEAGNRTVKKLVRDGSGNYSAATNLSMPAVTNSQFYSGIGGLTLDASGNLWATDLSDHRILKWTGGAGTPVEFKCASPTNCQFPNTGGTSVYLFSLPEGLVFDAGGNLWIGNNNDGYSPSLNATGGSLVKLSVSLLSGAGGTIMGSNATIYSTSAAKFGGMAKVGSDYFVNDQGNGKVWKVNTNTGALSAVGISATYPGNGHMADAPPGLFPTALGNPVVTPSSATINTGQTVTLTASGCAAGNTYLWSTGDATAVITKSPANTTTYTAYCKSGATQSSGTNVAVTVLPAPALSPSAVGLEQGTSITLTASGCATGNTYYWNTGAATASMIVTPAATTTYTAYCRNGTNQSTGRSVVVAVRYLENQPHSGVDRGMLAMPFSTSVIALVTLKGRPAMLEATMPTQFTTVSGTTVPYKAKALAFFGTDLMVAYDNPSLLSSSTYGIVHYKQVRAADGMIYYNSVSNIPLDASPASLAVDSQSGALFVGLSGTSRGVRKFGRSAGGVYDVAGNLSMPTTSNTNGSIGGLAFDASGNLWATDLADNRILKWVNGAGNPGQFTASATEFVNTGGEPVNLFSQPLGLAFDAAGNLWVANQNGPNSATPNGSGGSLVKINASLLAGTSGSIAPGNTTIYSVVNARFAGIGRIGSYLYINDQRITTQGSDYIPSTPVWQLIPTTGILSPVDGISATTAGSGATSEVPPAVDPTPPTVTPVSATITVGQSVTLTASGCDTGYSYFWYPSTYTASITVSPTVSTTYIVYCRNESGTSQSSATFVPVTVNPATSVTATGSISVTSSLQNANPRARTFTYALPGTQPDCNLPLLIVLHGDGGTGAGMMSYTNFNALGLTQKFITVYPDAGLVGGGIQWNKYADNVAGFGGSTPADPNAPDDVQFMANLIDYFHKKFGIDKSRVYVTGHSGGGFMAYALAIADLTKSRIAGIAPVAASLWGEDNYLTTQFGAGAFVPKPVLHSHATTDNAVPFPDMSGWVWPESSFGNATCGVSTPTSTTLNTDLVRYTFCAGSPVITSSKPVVLMALKRPDLAHNWPTTANAGYNTETEIWNFLSPYSQPQSGSAVSLSVTPASATIVAGNSVLLSASGCGSLTYKWSNSQTGSSINVSPLFTTTYTVGCYTDNACQVGGVATAMVTVTSGPVLTIDDHIKVDQFGYLPSSQKMAVISSPDPTVSQYNQASSFAPGSTYQLRNALGNTVVLSGSLAAWNGGATHAQSGDKVWWFDFSSVTTPGSYYVVDVANNKRSYTFDINPTVYDTLAKQALTALKMQRCGTYRFGQFGTKSWFDDACHIGSLQDTHCRDVSDPTNVSKERDMSGGWHDAGDFNKYSLYAAEALHNLLKAYEENPTAWTATTGGIPRILDEAKYELDWLLKMQDTDGGVRCKVSIKGFGVNSPPSADARQRFYSGKSTLTTLAVSSVLAHAASVFGTVLTTYSNTLKTAAQNAWNWASANPNVIFDNSPFVAGGGASFNPDDGIYSDASNNYYRATSYKTVAAAYLFNAYGTVAGASYKTAFESLYANTNQMTWTTGSDTYFPDWQVVLDALLTYASNAGANASHATAIRNQFTALVTTSPKLLPAYSNNTDAYRAYLNHYTWNSNQQKAQAGIQMQLLRASNLSAANNTALQEASLGYLHYLHGLNPNAKCYLSNMNMLGADNSQNEIYHGWFWDGTVYDNALTSSVGPFPGFLIGGPNQDYSGSIAPPVGQPAQKSYKDWNTDYPEASYEITEVGIYDQAAYIRLASKFIGGSGCTLAAGTAASIKSGSWTDPTTWQCGTIPTANSLTQIKAGHVVTINSLVQTQKLYVEIGGRITYTLSGRLTLTP